MTLLEIFLVAIGLSMDAFAVAICKGLAMPQVNKKQTLLIGAYFGVFQALMPLAGWLLGSQFAGYVTKLAPWIAFVLLAWIGGSMIRESLSKDEEDGKPEPVELRHRELLMLAVATSIDALAVGSASPWWCCPSPSARQRRSSAAPPSPSRWAACLWAIFSAPSIKTGRSSWAAPFWCSSA